MNQTYIGNQKLLYISTKENMMRQLKNQKI